MAWTVEPRILNLANAAGSGDRTRAEETWPVETLTNPVSLLIDDAVSTVTRMRPYRFTGQEAACDLCGNPSHDRVGSRDRYGRKLRIVLCTHCGLVYANPMPTEAEVDAFYARHYRKLYHNAYEPRPKAIFRAFKGAKGRYRFLEPILGRGTRILDVGSGGGEVVHHFRERGMDAHGVEPNRGFAEYSIEAYGIPVQVSGWQNARIEPESFDIVTANHVVEHFRTPFPALVRFRGWLKPDGHLHISVPDVYSPQRTPYSRFHFAHLHYFDRESLIMMGLKAGFEVSERLPGHSTTVVFRKAATPSADWFRYPENYDKLARYFRDYTNLKYFLSLKPYSRWFRRMGRLGGEMFQATFVPGDLDREKK